MALQVKIRLQLQFFNMAEPMESQLAVNAIYIHYKENQAK